MKYLWQQPNSLLQRKVEELLQVKADNSKVKKSTSFETVSNPVGFNVVSFNDNSVKFSKRNSVSKVDGGNKWVVTDGITEFNVKNVIGDGNCLFRCFSIILFGNEDNHVSIRKDCVNFVESN